MIFSEPKHQPGELYKPMDVVAENQGDTVRIKDYCELNVHSNLGESFFEMRGSAGQIQRESTGAGSPKRVIEFLLGLNGLIFSRSTKRNLDESFYKTRNIPDSASPEYWSFKMENLGNSFGFTRDFCFLKDGEHEFILSQVPEEFLKKSLGGMSLEFRYSEKFSDEKERRKVIEILGFILGKRLIRVGWNTLDERDFPILRTSFRPWSLNLIDECESNKITMPVPIDGIQDPLDENVINELLIKLTKNYESLNLEEVFFYYWMAARVPAGFSNVLYAGALESLCKSWVKFSGTKVEGSEDVERIEFERIIEPILMQMGELSKTNKHWGAVSKKLKNVIFVSGGFTLDRFLEKVGVKIGEVESLAMGERNKFTHGGWLNRIDEEKLVTLSHAYMVLIHKAVLCSIGYNGNYVDYTTIGFPSRDIADVLGGPKGDG